MSTNQGSTARLAHFPASFFAMVMGMAGLSIAWDKAQTALHLDLMLGQWLLLASVVLFVALLLAYIAKLALHRDAVLAELQHPVRLNFFPTISISLLLLAVALLPTMPVISHALWYIGAAMQLSLTLYIVSTWMHGQQFELHHLTPAWFIPVVGNAIVPIAGVPLGHPELSWFFFSIGMLLWSMLLTIVFYRVLFHHPIDQSLMPTLFILVAPPAVGFIAYTQLSTDLDVFAHALYFAALFLSLLLFSQTGRFLKLDFNLSWWAYSFPLAALSIASVVMFEKSGNTYFLSIGFGLLTMLSGIVLLLLTATALAMRAGRVCVPERNDPVASQGHAALDSQ